MEAGDILEITVEELEARWGTPLSDRLREKTKALSLKAERLGREERDSYMYRMLDVLLEDPEEKHDVVGAHRKERWEAGWMENVNDFIQSGDPSAALPGYFNKYPVVRWGGDLVKPVTENFEYGILSLLVDWTMETFMGDCDALFEFGCGPAYHLLRIRQFFADKSLHGLDWTEASQAIIQKMSDAGVVSDIHGHNFNFFEPDDGIPLGPGAGVYTVAALEQVGNRYDTFVDFLIKKKPSLVAHIEPFDEIVDSEKSLLDRFSVAYCRKRNYLDGMLPYLREKAARGEIEIVREQRTWTGSLFLEGHSLVVWRPC